VSAYLAARIKACSFRIDAEQRRATELADRLAPPGCGQKATLHGFFENCGTVSTIAAPIVAHKGRGPGDAARQRKRNRMGSAMRDSYDMGIPDTAPYKEWLGVVGSIVVAALVGVTLFSGGILS
jgi:hypothetical protein